MEITTTLINMQRIQIAGNITSESQLMKSFHNN
jgi:hypothetical protein